MTSICISGEQTAERADLTWHRAGVVVVLVVFVKREGAEKHWRSTLKFRSFCKFGGE